MSHDVATPDALLGTLAKFLGILRNAGLPMEFVQEIIDNAGFREWFFETVIPRYQFEQALKRFPPCERVTLNELHRNFRQPRPETRKRLRDIPFSLEVLQSSLVAKYPTESSHKLIPDIGTSIAEMHRVDKRFFAAGDHPWLREEFAQRTETPTWRLVRKKGVEAVPKEEELLSARQVVYTYVILSRMMINNMSLVLPVRTSDKDADGNCIFIHEIKQGKWQGLVLSTENPKENKFILLTARNP